MISLSTSEVVCPQDLLNKIKLAQPSVTAVANAGTSVVMESVKDACDAGVITPLFAGVSDDIRREADALNWDISGFEIIEAGDEGEAAAAAAKAAGEGRANVLMKGHVHTDTFMRSILNKDHNLRTGQRFSHIFHMTCADRDGSILISDGAVNVAPDFKTHQSILTNIIQVAHALGKQRPNVALLSATEEVTETIPSSVAADELRKWAQEQNFAAEVFGPVAFDLAVSQASAAIKGVSGPGIGAADALVVPDLVTGNALFKMMVYYMGACAAGVVLGARVPVILTSRADPPQARLASAALAALVAIHASHSS